MSALTACCCDGTSPAQIQVDGSFALATVDDALLPALVAESDGQRYFLLADTLRFARGGTVTRSIVYRRVGTNTAPADSVHESRVTLPYTVEGDRLTIGSREPCADTAACIGVEEGTITAPDAIALVSIYWPGKLLRFERVPQE